MPIRVLYFLHLTPCIKPLFPLVVSRFVVIGVPKEWGKRRVKFYLFVAFASLVLVMVGLIDDGGDDGCDVRIVHAGAQTTLFVASWLVAAELGVLAHLLIAKLQSLGGRMNKQTKTQAAGFVLIPICMTAGLVLVIFDKRWFVFLYYTVVSGAESTLPSRVQFSPSNTDNFLCYLYLYFSASLAS